MNITQKRIDLGCLNFIAYGLYWSLVFYTYGRDIEDNGIWMFVLFFGTIPAAGSAIGFCVGRFTGTIPWKRMLVAVVGIDLLVWIVMWSFGSWGFEILIPIVVSFFLGLFVPAFLLAALFGRSLKNPKKEEVS